MKPTIGILKPGSTFAEMIERFGDYDAWFVRALGPDVGTRVHGPDGRLPEPGDVDAWIVTGARSSVLDEGTEVERLLDWIREVVVRQVPLLGVCYGHQAVAAALGGRVERHAAGWEIGTVEVELTDEGRSDLLFAGFPHRFLVHTTHEDQVAEAPPGATILARNDHTPFQALGIGESIRTVQFHPEVDEQIARDFVDRRRHLIHDSPVVAETTIGRRTLANFVQGFVPHAHRR
jgi:GMP synthase (glutamine-hydrolysing)